MKFIQKYANIIKGGDVVKVIWNYQIGASSCQDGFEPYWCRLNHPDKCWKPDRRDMKLNNSWIRLDLKDMAAIPSAKDAKDGDKKMITKIRIQGTPGHTAYCKSIWIDYSNDGTTWTCHNSLDGEIKLIYDKTEENYFGVMDDSKDTDKFAEIQIFPAIHARFIRIRPSEYHNEIALRFDILGRNDHNSEIARCVRFGDLSREDQSEARKKIKHAEDNQRIIQVDCKAVIRRALDAAHMTYVGYVIM